MTEKKLDLKTDFEDIKVIRQNLIEDENVQLYLKVQDGAKKLQIIQDLDEVINKNVKTSDE